MRICDIRDEFGIKILLPEEENNKSCYLEWYYLKLVYCDSFQLFPASASTISGTERLNVFSMRETI